MVKSSIIVSELFWQLIYSLTRNFFTLSGGLHRSHISGSNSIFFDIQPNCLNLAQLISCLRVCAPHFMYLYTIFEKKTAQYFFLKEAKKKRKGNTAKDFFPPQQFRGMWNGCRLCVQSPLSDWTIPPLHLGRWIHLSTEGTARVIRGKVDWNGHNL